MAVAMKLQNFAVVAAVVGLLTACDTSADNDPGRACPEVNAIQIMPFREERGVDLAYDKLRFDAQCEPILWKTATSDKLMPDPREEPKYGGFTEGDAAVFVLVDKYHVPLEEVLPDDQAEDWKAHGVWAYFEYVESPRNRVAAVARLKERLVDKEKLK